MNNPIRRSGLVAGLALLMSFATATPASATNPEDLGAGPIKVAVSTSADGDQATILFNIFGIPEPEPPRITFDTYPQRPWDSADIERNSTMVGLSNSEDPNAILTGGYGYYFGLPGQPWQMIVTSTAKPLNGAFIPPYGVAAVGETVSISGIELTSVDWGDGSTPLPLQASHIYQKTGIFTIAAAWTGDQETGIFAIGQTGDGTKGQGVTQLTVVPAGTSIADRYGVLIQDLAFSKGQNVISGSIELTYDAVLGKWEAKDMFLRSPDGRLQAITIFAAPYFLNDEKNYLNVFVQSTHLETTWVETYVPKADANGYVPGGFYHVAVPITVPAAPVASASPSAVPVTPTPSASPVVSPTDQGGPINPLLGLGALLFLSLLSLMLFIAFRRRRAKKGA